MPEFQFLAALYPGNRTRTNFRNKKGYSGSSHFCSLFRNRHFQGTIVLLSPIFLVLKLTVRSTLNFFTIKRETAPVAIFEQRKFSKPPKFPLLLKQRQGNLELAGNKTQNQPSVRFFHRANIRTTPVPPDTS